MVKPIGGPLMMIWTITLFRLEENHPIPCLINVPLLPVFTPNMFVIYLGSCRLGKTPQIYCKHIWRYHNLLTPYSTIEVYFSHSESFLIGPLTGKNGFLKVGMRGETRAQVRGGFVCIPHPWTPFAFRIRALIPTLYVIEAILYWNTAPSLALK